MFGKTIVFAALLAVAVAELPVGGSYAPSGWKPAGAPFRLPNQYILPEELRDPGVQLEITKERVDYAGQFTDTNTLRLPLNTAYLPPNGDLSGVDFLRVQSLPVRPFAQFKVVRGSQFFPQRQLSQIRRPQKVMRFKQFQRQRLQPINVPSEEYGAPVSAPDTQYGAPAAEPATQYGAPVVGYPDPRTPVEGDNAEAENFSDGTITKGEYFILTPEKTLQKVSYRTSQNEEEAKTNGFTAELKYTPVEKVDGPLYKYSEQGQLVRINKK